MIKMVQYNMDVNNDEKSQLDKPPTESERISAFCAVIHTSDIPASLSDPNKNVDNDDFNNNDVDSGWTGVSDREENNGPDVDLAELTLSDKDNMEELKKIEGLTNRIQAIKGFQPMVPTKFQEPTNCKNVKSGCSTKNNNNNNNDCPADCFDERNFLLAMEDERRHNWKNDGGAYFGDEEGYRMRFPWKRIAYIGVLLVLGITCAILALMKLCGGADWMNTATFSVIIMGTVMLLPPGLYYGRILICICCRCKEYSLWDVPAGPFG